MMIYKNKILNYEHNMGRGRVGFQQLLQDLTIRLTHVRPIILRLLGDGGMGVYVLSYLYIGPPNPNPNPDKCEEASPRTKHVRTFVNTVCASRM